LNYATTLIQLYYLAVHADGEVAESELALGRQILRVENLPEGEIDRQRVEQQNLTQAERVERCSNALRALSRESQIRCMAWMCLIADADWVVNNDEWSVITALYSDTLNLPLSEIVLVQAELNEKLREDTIRNR